MLSDLGKHEETRDLRNGPLGVIALYERLYGTPESVRSFIEEFVE
jgi:hypothetical protein